MPTRCPGNTSFSDPRSPTGRVFPNTPKHATDFEKVAIPVGVADPTLGFTSATLDAKGVPLAMTLTDSITDLLAGRRPLSDFDQVVKDWQSNGGNAIRTELEQAIAAAA